MSDNIQKNIGSILAILMALLGWAITWGAVQSKVESAQLRLDKVEYQIDNQSEKINTIDKNVVEVKSDIKYIKESIRNGN